jgi:hypothetical protein
MIKKLEKLIIFELFLKKNKTFNLNKFFIESIKSGYIINTKSYNEYTFKFKKKIYELISIDNFIGICIFINYKSINISSVIKNSLIN